MVGTILITGGTGKTGYALSRKLQSAGCTTLLTTRDPSKVAPPLKGVKFDWEDQSTYENPWDVDPNIDRVYLVLPEVPAQFENVKVFVDLAVEKGAKRFVLLSATVYEKGKPGTGLTHEYLESLGVEYHALRPTWFFENFGSPTGFLGTIKSKSEIPSTTKQGKVPFVSAEDVAEAAKVSLLADTAPNTDTILVGPELLSYDEVTEILSEVVGRKITHRHTTGEESVEYWVQNKVPEDIAKYLVVIEGLVANGTEASHVNAERKYVGKKKLRDYFEENKDIFASA
ncbi:hypothetical protein AX16_007082 [Volvariella volvacea WC 439]|nr:hypothetical protein AX16_007082 [Volvariella volvacea WC 439]